ncbi:hypothetical protein [Gracilibacillus thailandensis]|uniref:hypothetical protein n=1 Tax=Gracilibacillus thailandensis TaxID=563735 RepID=UPI002B4AF7B1|nr:hypothetical protein [Gracilibacillus thailandensis]
MKRLYTILAYSSLTVALLSVVLAVSGKRYYYWVSAIGIYIFSFLAGFSIGQLTVGLTFIPLVLAVGYTFGWIKNKAQILIVLSIGVLIGIIMVFFVDDKWVFLPFWIFS